MLNTRWPAGRRTKSKRKVWTQPEPNLVISPDWPEKIQRIDGDEDDADAADARFSGCPVQQRHFRTTTIPVYKLPPCRAGCQYHSNPPEI